MTEPVYVIGAGIHPFGRTEGMSGREQGVFAVRQALAGAGLEWADMEWLMAARQQPAVRTLWSMSWV